MQQIRSGGQGQWSRWYCESVHGLYLHQAGVVLKKRAFLVFFFRLLRIVLRIVYLRRETTSSFFKIPVTFTFIGNPISEICCCGHPRPHFEALS